MRELISILMAAIVAFAMPVVKSTGNHSNTSKAKSTSAQTLVVLYTASATGQIRSCNCTKFRFGGYGRESTLVKSIRMEYPDTLLLEGGDATAGSDFQSALKADVTAKAVKMLGYNAMLPGDEELGIRGIKFINKFDPKSVPIICANIHKEGENKQLYSPYVILKTKNGLKVGVIGLMGDVVSKTLFTRTTNLVVLDQVNVLKSLLKTIRAKSDIVIVLYHGNNADAGKLASIKGVDLILSTHRSHTNIIFPPKPTNEISAPVTRQGSVFIVDAETKSNWSLGLLKLTLAKDRKIKSVDHTLKYLDGRYDEDPKIVKIFEDYNEKVKQAVLSKSGGLKRDVEVMLIKRGLDPEQMRKRLRKSPYVTAEKCKDCHLDIYESWAKSRHAHAMSTLEKNHQEFDPECVSCHSTGVFARNGFTDRKTTPELSNVQCEACHGSGVNHIASPSKGFGETGELLCRSCHTEERTHDFNYNEAWTKIKH